jgi:hypothetical protein
VNSKFDLDTPLGLITLLVGAPIAGALIYVAVSSPHGLRTFVESLVIYLTIVGGALIYRRFRQRSGTRES